MVEETGEPRIRRSQETGQVTNATVDVGDMVVSVSQDPNSQGIEAMVFPKDKSGGPDVGRSLFHRDFKEGTPDDIEEAAQTLANQLKAGGIDELREHYDSD